MADAHHLHPGSKATIATATGTISLRITGIYRRDEIADSAIVTPGALGAAGSTLTDWWRRFSLPVEPGGSRSSRPSRPPEPDLDLIDAI